MWYVILGRDASGSLAKRKELREQHLKRLQALQAEGRLLLAGPLPAIDSPDPGPAGFQGSLIVAEFDSLAEARAWIEEDPYAKGGVYADVAVYPFLKVFPRSEDE